MRWWGWGRDDASPHLPPDANVLRFLRESLGVAAPPHTPPPPLESVLDRLPPSRLDAAALDALSTAASCTTEPLQRLLHSCGKSYRDLIRLRSDDPPSAPDAVVFPASEDEVGRILALCDGQGIAVVPFGGGTSVVGGVEALSGSHHAVVSLDLRRLQRVLRIDAESRVAEVEAGIFGPELEAALGQEGWSLGHFPQSFEFSTLGGWVATRSAGQNSTGYGKIEDMVVGLHAVSPRGRFTASAVPARATGPDLKQALVGSEGTLAVITRVTVRVHPRPESQLYRGFLFPTFEDGFRAARALVHEGLPLALLRLSDNPETGMLMRLSARGGPLRSAIEGLLLSTRGYRKSRMTLMLAGFDGTRDETRAAMTRARKLLGAARALDLGTRPGARWLRGRFDLPYLRDVLMDRGMLVETLETSTLWSRLPALYQAAGEAIRGALGSPSFVACHLSHVYPEGASLYFTFLAPQQHGREQAQWDDVKRAATDAIMRSGGTLSHHHGVGADHRPWIDAEWGEAGVRVGRAMKSALDPQGILNPGKLFG